MKRHIKGWVVYLVAVTAALAVHTLATEADSHAEPRRTPARQA